MRSATRALAWLGAAAIALAPLAGGGVAVQMAEHVALWDLLPIAVLVLGVPWIRVHPVAALALWFACLAAWHAPPAFDAAVRHDGLHVLQHACFFLVGLTMWVPALRSSLALPLRLAYVLAMQLGGLVLANVLLWSSALYDRYRVGDQRVAGGILLLEGSALLIAVFAWLFLKLASEPDVPEPT